MQGHDKWSALRELLGTSANLANTPSSSLRAGLQFYTAGWPEKGPLICRVERSSEVPIVFPRSNSQVLAQNIGCVAPEQRRNLYFCHSFKGKIVKPSFFSN